MQTADKRRIATAVKNNVVPPLMNSKKTSRINTEYVNVRSADESFAVVFFESIIVRITGHSRIVRLGSAKNCSIEKLSFKSVAEDMNKGKKRMLT